jgi:hypothetical protein
MNRSRLPVLTAALALVLAGGATTVNATDEDQTRPSTVPLITSLTEVEGQIAPGWYVQPLTARADGPYAAAVPLPLRAIVQIPAGYSASDGATVTADDPPTDRRAPSLTVAGGITRVDTEPCGGGRLVDPGPTVSDLADALAPHATSAPRAVTVDGAQGLYLVIDPPDSLSACPGGIFRLFDDRADRVPWTNHLWVLNVEGHRVVTTVRTMDEATEESRRTIHMAENLMFLHTRAPH